jgi:hypothetical protein
MKAFVLSILVALVSGCALEQEVSRTPRTAVEQVLLTQAVEQALENLSIRLPEGVNVDVDATGLESDRSRLRTTNADLGAIDRPSRDILYIRDVVAAELGRRGYRVSARDTESPYLVRVMAESFGTMQGTVFVGMPPVQSVFPSRCPNSRSTSARTRVAMLGCIWTSTIIEPVSFSVRLPNWSGERFTINIRC